MPKKRKILYHLSPHRFDFFNVARREPSHRSENEPATPRLCVSDSVAGCLAARLFPKKTIYVYQTDRPMKGVTPVGVWDSVITGERWLIPPAKMVLVGELSQQEIEDAQGLFWTFHKRTGKSSSLRLRISQLENAWRVVGDRFPGPASRRFSARVFRKFVGAESPVDFVHGEMG